MQGVAEGGHVSQSSKTVRVQVFVLYGESMVIRIRDYCKESTVKPRDYCRENQWESGSGITVRRGQ